MVDLVASLFVVALVVCVAGVRTLLALLPAREPNPRLEGYGSILLGRGLMEVAYRLCGPLVRMLVAVGVTPNMVTGFSLVPALVSAVLMATGHFGLGALFATLSGFCDMVDGMLARRHNSMSDAGGLFDAAVDRYVEYFLLAGLAIYFRGSVLGLVLCLVAALGSFMVSYGSAKAEALGVEPPKGAMRRAERTVYVILGSSLAPLWELIVPGDRMFAFIAYGRALPVELALLLVAVVANVSAVRRMLRIAELARAKQAPRDCQYRPGAGLGQ